MLYPILLTLASLYNLILVAIVLRAAPVLRERWGYAFYLFWVSAWVGCVAVGTWPGLAPHVELFVLRATFCCATLFGMGWVWFCASFPQPSPSFRPVALVIIVISTPWLVLAWGDHLLLSVGPSTPLWAHAEAGPLLGVYGIWNVVCVLVAEVYLLWRMRRLTGLERMQANYVLLASTAMIGTGLVFNVLLPALTHSTRFSPLGPLGSLFLSTATVYVLAHYRLRDITTVLRTGLAYSITVGMATLLFALVVPVLDHLLPQQGISHVAGFGAALLLALVFQPLRVRVGELLDASFFRCEYDFRQTLQETSRLFAAIQDTDSVVDGLSKTIIRTLKPRITAVYLQEHADTLTLVSCSPLWGELPRTLAKTDPLYAYLATNDAPQPAGELARWPEPYAAMGNLLQSWSIALALPLLTGERLCGVVLLAAKLSGDMYTAEDLALLTTIGKQAALALDNARHYDALRRVNATLDATVAARTQELHATLTRLEQEQAFLDSAIELLPIPIAFISPEHHPQRSNPAWERLFDGYQGQFTRYDTFTHTEAPCADWPESRALAGETVVAAPSVLIFTNERELHVLTYAAPVYHDGVVVAALLAVLDVTPLHEADKSKEEFLAVLSHELLTPLTSILGWAGLGRDGLPPAQAQEAFETIERNARRQLARLNDLLDISRITHRKMPLEPAATDLRALIDAAVDEVDDRARTRGITLQVHPPAEAMTVSVDPARLRQAIGILLSNAVKYSAAGGKVVIYGASEANVVWVSVSDTGRGIPHDVLPYLFTPFLQVQRDESQGGLGLGLALAKGIVELHGGRLQVASRGVGQGSTFTIILPRADAPPSPTRWSTPSDPPTAPRLPLPPQDVTRTGAGHTRQLSVNACRFSDPTITRRATGGAP